MLVSPHFQRTLWVRNHHLQHQTTCTHSPFPQSIDVACCKFPISPLVKILGVTLDSTLSLNMHVATLSKACGFHIRALRHIRNALTDESAKSIACAFVGSRLYYINALFMIDASESNVTKLQRIQNTLAHIITRQHGWTETSQSLATLHWLPVKWRVDSRLPQFFPNSSRPVNLFTWPTQYLNYVPGRSLRSTGDGQARSQYFGGRGPESGAQH